jgi:hypothetical protein
MTPDEICEKFAAREVKITCRMLEDDLVLLEGTREGLEMLGNLILAQAKFDQDCGIELSPIGAGSALFNRNSDKGICIHRVPCEHRKED